MNYRHVTNEYHGNEINHDTILSEQRKSEMILLYNEEQNYGKKNELDEEERDIETEAPVSFRVFVERVV